MSNYGPCSERGINLKIPNNSSENWHNLCYKKKRIFSFASSVNFLPRFAKNFLIIFSGANKFADARAIKVTNGYGKSSVGKFASPLKKKQKLKIRTKILL